MQHEWRECVGRGFGVHPDTIDDFFNPFEVADIKEIDDIVCRSWEGCAGGGNEYIFIGIIRAFACESDRESAAEGIADDEVVVIGVEIFQEACFDAFISVIACELSHWIWRKPVAWEIKYEKILCRAEHCLNERHPCDSGCDEPINQSDMGTFGIESRDASDVHRFFADTLEARGHSMQNWSSHITKKRGSNPTAF